MIDNVIEALRSAFVLKEFGFLWVILAFIIILFFLSAKSSKNNSLLKPRTEKELARDENYKIVGQILAILTFVGIFAYVYYKAKS